MLNSDLSPAAPQGGRLPPTDKTCVVSTSRWVPTNWVSGRTLQPSIESVVANSFVPSDFLVDGQVSGLGTVHPLLTLSFVSTWILPLHVVSSTLKRKSSSSVMDGHQRRSITTHLKSLHWLPVKVRSTYKIACLCYHCHSSTAPSYVVDMLHKKPSHTRITHSSSYTMPLLNRPAHSKATLGDRSFSFASPVWNSIPNVVRCAPMK